MEMMKDTVVNIKMKITECAGKKTLLSRLTRLLSYYF